jgi:perosamine synthetase
MGWNHHHSDFLNEFTKAFASYVGAEFAIPTDSCTSALHLALWSLGIGPGDEVIVPEVTWVATANAVKYVGATPIFADIDPITWCLDPKSVETLITKRTRAIMPVHLYGYVSDLNPLKNLCDKFDLKLVQDAAPGIGSTYFDQGVAKIGEFSCFSFQGAKLLVSGEGGVLTTNDADLYAKAFKIGDSGRRPGTFWIELLGKKMKMSNVTASLALAQLQSAERQIAKKRKIRDWYVEELSEIEGVTFQQELPNSRSICWMTSIQIEREKFDREKFRSELLKLGVESRPVFSPISRYPIWGKELEPKPNAVKIGDNSINLPSGVALSRSTVAKVSDAVRRVLL